MALLEKEILLGFSLPARLLVTYNIHFKILSLERNGVLERNRDTLSKATSTLYFQKSLVYGLTPRSNNKKGIFLYQKKKNHSTSIASWVLITPRASCPGPLLGQPQGKRFIQ